MDKELGNMNLNFAKDNFDIMKEKGRATAPNFYKNMTSYRVTKTPSPEKDPTYMRHTVEESNQFKKISKHKKNTQSEANIAKFRITDNNLSLKEEKISKTRDKNSQIGDNSVENNATIVYHKYYFNS